jgi:hypothetical protein
VSFCEAVNTKNDFCDVEAPPRQKETAEESPPENFPPPFLRERGEGFIVFLATVLGWAGMSDTHARYYV